MKSLLITVLCLLFACLASAIVIEGVYEYSDAACNSEIATVYTALEPSGICDTIQCSKTPTTNSSVAAVSSVCLSSLPSQPANTIRLGLYNNANCNFTQQDGSLIAEAKLGKEGCVNGTYYTCSGGSFSVFTCSDSQCNVNCTVDPDDPTYAVDQCLNMAGVTIKLTCTGGSTSSTSSRTSTSTSTSTGTGTSSASSLVISSFFILATFIIVILAF